VKTNILNASPVRLRELFVNKAGYIYTNKDSDEGVLLDVSHAAIGISQTSAPQKTLVSQTPVSLNKRLTVGGE
jgi:hypothetical protein